MSIKIDYTKVKSAEEAYKIVKENVTPESIEKYKVKVDFKYNDAKNEIFAKGKGFKMTMSFTDKDAEIKLDLSFLLKPLKGKISGSVAKQISRLL
ncbi:MAG: hypothetical protein ACI9QD_000911 [Thermoproteota archaeon]|jgi:hypothetical protein